MIQEITSGISTQFSDVLQKTLDSRIRQFLTKGLRSGAAAL